LGTLNQTREALGLDPYASFDQVSSNPETAAALEQAYGNVDAIDLWTGGLSEDHLGGAAIGPTFGRILSDQFAALRDGDRLYFENQGFNRQTLDDIRSTTLSDIIERNTDTTVMQADAFVSTERHSGTLGGVDPTGAEAVEGQAQLVIGSPGNDTLTGGPKDDTLVAASGNQTMTGGAGADTFVLNVLNFDNMGRGHNTATITDFDPLVDTLQYSGDLDVHRSSNHHGGTLLHVGSETINLLGVSPDETLQVNGGTVGPERHDHEHVRYNHEHDHHDDLFF
jgi:peroxidase